MHTFVSASSGQHLHRPVATGLLYCQLLVALADASMSSVVEAEFDFETADEDPQSGLD